MSVRPAQAKGPYTGRISGGGGGVASVSATAPVVSSGGANPVISLNGLVSLGTALQLMAVNAAGTLLEWVGSTGTGSIVRATSPTIATATLTGVTTATRININGATDNAAWPLNVTGAVGITGGFNSYGVGAPGSTNYERLVVNHSGTSASILSEAGGTGTVRTLALIVGGTTRYSITSAGAHTMTGAVGITGVLTVTASNMMVSNAAGGDRSYVISTSGSRRWGMRANSTAESGGNAGSNFNFVAYDDTGAQIDAPFEIVRAAAGLMTFNRPIRATSLAGTGVRIVAANATGDFSAIGTTGAGGNIVLSASPTLTGTVAAAALTTSGLVNFSSGLLQVDPTGGGKIGFFNATPINVPSTGINITTSLADPVLNTVTFTSQNNNNAQALEDIQMALRNIGLLLFIP